jgi:hypothetical protein
LISSAQKKWLQGRFSPKKLSREKVSPAKLSPQKIVAYGKLSPALI